MTRPRLDSLPLWGGVIVGAIGGALVPLAGYLLGSVVPEIPALFDIHDARDVDFTED